MPSDLLFLCFLLAVNCYFHSVVKHGIVLIVVHDVELYTVSFSCVLHPEIEPLSVTLCVYVILHQAIIL